MPKLIKTDFILTSAKSNDDFERYYQFRWEQLRKPLNLPLGSERGPLDERSFHCMALNCENLIIGVGSIQSADNNTMRIRYMAVMEEMRCLGIGNEIVKSLLAYAVENRASKCWLYARSNDTQFYKKQGFEVLGEVETELSVPHFKMGISLIG